MQLGARGLQVVLLVLRESVLTVVAGTVLGVAVAFSLTASSRECSSAWKPVIP